MCPLWELNPSRGLLAGKSWKQLARSYSGVDSTHTELYNCMCVCADNHPVEKVLQKEPVNNGMSNLVSL